MVDRGNRSTNEDFMNEWRRQAVHYAKEGRWREALVHNLRIVSQQNTIAGL